MKKLFSTLLICLKISEIGTLQKWPKQVWLIKLINCLPNDLKLSEKNALARLQCTELFFIKKCLVMTIKTNIFKL